MSDKKPIVRLHHWCVRKSKVDPWTPPETVTTHLQGVVDKVKIDDEHPKAKKWYTRQATGDLITTSHIVSASGRTIETTNTTYILGAIDPKYRKWMKDNDIEYDQREPIKFR